MSAYSYRTDERECDLPTQTVSSPTIPHNGRHVKQRRKYSESKQSETKRSGANHLEHARQLKQRIAATDQSSERSSATQRLARTSSDVNDSAQSTTVQGHFVVESLRVSGDVLMSKINDLVSQGNVHRIVIKNKEGHTLLSVPTTVRVMGSSNIESILSTEAIAIDVISAIVPYPKLVIEKFG